MKQYRFDDFELYPASRELWRQGERVRLPPKSLECLIYLIANRHRAVGRDELIAAVWGRVDASDTVVAQTLLRARKAVEDTGGRQARVRTVTRFGYQWIAPVEETVASLPMASPPEEPSAAAGSPTRAMSTTSPRFTPRLLWLTALFTMLGVLAWLGWKLLPRTDAAATPRQAQTDLVLVLPVSLASEQEEDAWIRLGAMDYLAQRLRRSGLAVVSSEQTLRLNTALVPGSLDETAALKLEQASGARWIILPEATRLGRGWRIRLQIHEGKRLLLQEGRGATPLAAVASAADAWLRRTGNPTRDMEFPSALTERLQQIDSEFNTGQLARVKQLIDSAPPSQRNDSRLHVREAQLEFRNGRIDAAAARFDRILQDDHAPDEARIVASMGLGAVAIRRQDFNEADRRYGHALTLLEAQPASLHEPNLIGQAYNGRGVARVELGRMDEAVEDMGRARIAMQRAGDLVEAAMVDSNLGIIETRRRHYPQAIQNLDRAITTFERFDVRDYLAVTLASRVQTLQAMAQPNEALNSAKRAEVVARSTEDSALLSRVIITRADAEIEAGRLRDAKASIERIKALDNPPASLLSHLSLQLALSQGNDSAAAGWARVIPDDKQPVPAQMTWVAVQAALRIGDQDMAQRWLERSADHAAPSFRSLLATAWLAQAKGDPTRAHELALKAIAAAEKDGSPADRAEAGAASAVLMLRMDQLDAAASMLGDLDTFAESDYRVAWATWQLYRRLGDTTLARRLEQQTRNLQGDRNLAHVPLL